MSWPLNMEQLDGAADWEDQTAWQGAGPEPILRQRAPRLGDPNTCAIRAQRNGKYRVRWVAKNGVHGQGHAYDSYEEAESAARVLERDCGYRLVG